MLRRRYRRYVVEDRWTAIRWAIGTARDRDIVVIAGRGAQDHVDWVIEGQPLRVGSPPQPAALVHLQGSSHYRAEAHACCPSSKACITAD